MIKNKYTKKTVYKLYNNSRTIKTANFKLIGSITAAFVGSNILYSVYNLEDTNISRLIKAGMLGVVIEETLRQQVLIKKYSTSNYYLRAFILYVKLYLENKIDDDSISMQKKYLYEIEKNISKVSIEELHDNDVLTFILKLNDKSYIKEIVSKDDYKCYYKDIKNDEIDITDISCQFLKRKQSK